MAEPAGSHPAVLAVENLSAGYGGRPVIEGIGFTLGKGDVLGLLGANGSGKSTLLKAITGQISLLQGRVTVAGTDLRGHPEQAKASLGLAVDPPDLPKGLSGRQYLELVASIRGCATDSWPCGDVPDGLALLPWLDHAIADCSLGTQAKISIAAALLGAPPLLVFDETLNGLDPIAAWEAKRIIAELAGAGRHAVIVSTHIVEAVPTLCNRAILLAEGRIARHWGARELADAGRAPGAFEASVMRALGARIAAADGR